MGGSNMMRFAGFSLGSLLIGASVDRLVRFVLRQAMVLVGLGIGIGLAVARVAARYVDPILFEVSASDPTIYALVGVALLLVAGLAGSLPAWRATRDILVVKFWNEHALAEWVGSGPYRISQAPA